MPKHLLNFQLLTKTPLQLLYWLIYSLNYTYLSNQHTSYSPLKTQTEYACVPHVNFKITYYQGLNWVRGERNLQHNRERETRSNQKNHGCRLPHRRQLPWFLLLFFQSPMTCKRGRHYSVHLFWFQWKFVIFPLFAGLFSLFFVGIWLPSNLVV